MPVYLKEADVTQELDGAKSVLIVPCRFCPAASMAVQTHAPLIALFRNFLTTQSYEQMILEMQRGFETRGIKTDVFRSHLLHQFVLCMWTSKRRESLAERAKKYDALVVLGCETATQTVRNAVKSCDCKVIQGMTSHGIMAVKPGFRLPCNFTLELESVTHMKRPARETDGDRQSVEAWSLQWRALQASRLEPTMSRIARDRLDE